MTTGPEPDSLQVGAQQLRDVAGRIEEFLLRQIDWLQEEMTKAARTAGELELGSLQEEFERMREQLEQNREQEMAQIREDARRLAESW